MTQKVLYLTPGCFDKGGISRYSRYQISALQEIVGDENVRAFSLLGPDEKSFEIPFKTYFHGRTGYATHAGRARFAVNLLREVILWRPDVIHTAHVNFAGLANLLAQFCGAQTILNVYGLELWGDLSVSRAKAMGKCDVVISDCHATAAYVTGNKLHPTTPRVVWDCVDLERFRPGEADRKVIDNYRLPDPRKFPIVLTLGRLSKGAAHKGVDRLIKAFAKVHAEMPQVRLVIAGEGDDRVRLEQIAISQGIDDMVTFTGAVDEADMTSIYRVARVFSLVSDVGFARGEGIPLTPLEALACGVPVVVGDEDGSKEAIDNERNGLVVSPRRQDELVCALLKLLRESPEQARRRAIEARAVARERFGYQAFVASHREIYANLAP